MQVGTNPFVLVDTPLVISIVPLMQSLMGQESSKWFLVCSLQLYWWLNKFGITQKNKKIKKNNFFLVKTEEMNSMHA